MLPKLFLERMKKLLGEEYPAFLEAFSMENRRGLRVNTIKADAASFLEGGYFPLERVPWTKDGFYVEGADKPGKSPLPVFIICRSLLRWRLQCFLRRIPGIGYWTCARRLAERQHSLPPPCRGKAF